MNAKKILKTLNYLPRWAWYLLSFFVAGPFGILGVYLVFHVLKKIESDQEQEKQQAAQFSRDGSTYEDAECTVTSDEDIEARWARTQASAADAQQSENADVNEVIRSGREALRSIRRANDIIADEALSAQIDSIENSCTQILSLLAQRPQLLEQLRTFLRYYLPTTLKLLDARARLENSANTPKARQVRAQISDALGVIETAFRRQMEALDEYRFLDLESEMDVLRDMLRADGLVDDGDNRPFAAGGH